MKNSILTKMVCWIKRIKRLGLDIFLDDNVEKELMKELNVSNHNELERALKFLHDETLESIMKSIMNRKKKVSIRRKELSHDMYR